MEHLSIWQEGAFCELGAEGAAPVHRSERVLREDGRPDQFMNFDLFTSKLQEMREYRSGRDYWSLIANSLAKTGAVGNAELISADEQALLNDHFRTSHIVHSASAQGCQLLQETFGIALPSDFVEFYSRWSDVLLTLREAYWIMPVEEIVSTNLYWRGVYGSKKEPVSVVRFGRYFEESGQHFALQREGAEASWRVAMVNDRDLPVDDDLVGEEDVEWRVTDQSFSAWLDRMLLTDGTPWTPGGEEEECNTIRVR